MSEPSSTLTALVPTTPQLLAYTIPLFIISLPLTFAGTFLTLDRSRSFPSSYAPVPLPGAFDGPKKISKTKFPLQGGVGGLASGYVFGVQLSTFLSLLVPAVSSSAKLSPKSFLAVWILSCLLTTILGGRYGYCARVFAALMGGSLLALVISVVIHPSLLPRQILTALLAILSLLVPLIFSLPALSRFLRPILRVLTASSGAFSIVLSISLLAHIPAWADIWERLWLRDGDSWGTSKEKGLSATYFMLLGIGIASDYGFNKWLGECPDEKWDHFLANYSANLPNSSDRAGSFRPFPIKSLWGRLLGTLGSREKRDSLFPLPPSTGHSRNSIAKDPTDVFSDDEYDKDFAKPYLHSQDLPYDDLPASPILLRKARSQNVEHKPHKARGFQKNPLTRKWPIKFGQDLSSDSSDDDSDAPQHINIRPWLKKMASTNSSSPTLVDQSARISLEHEMVQKARPKPQGGRSTAVSSDYEEDIGGRRSDSSVTQKDVGWRPGFLNRHSSLTKMNGISGGSLDGSHSSAPIAAVPATPSLIKALDRISVAQRDAFGPPSAPHALVSSLRPSDFAITTRVDGIPGLREVQGERSDAESDIEVGRREHLALGWDEFWKEVKHKATA